MQLAPGESKPFQHTVYLRRHKDTEAKTREEMIEQTETVIDLSEMKFISESLIRRTKVDKFKISDSSNLVAFTVDIGNTEILTLGFKNLETKEILPI